MGEMSNLLKVWISVYFCLCYCYAIAKLVPKGCTRLACLLPIVCLFLYLPLFISSLHLGALTSFFIAWLANFKLLLLAFGKGPLSSDTSISLGRFVALACLPIKIQQNNPPPNQSDKHNHLNTQNETIESRENPPLDHQIETNPSPKSHIISQNKENPPLDHQIGTNPSPQKSHIDRQSKQNPPLHPQNGRKKIPQNPKKGHRIPLNYVIKGLLLGIVLRAYDFSDHLHPNALLLLYSLHMYLLLELILAVVATLARALLAIELEPQFNEPYLSTSLQDFWGRRWNLMVTSILRPTVYEPVLAISKRVVVDPKCAPLPAVLATFAVSALMHEIVFYHMGRMRPTWGVTWFFLLHGICLAVEIFLKKAFVTGRWRLPRLVSGFLTVGFVMITVFWLFLPQFLRFEADVKAFEEYAALGEFCWNLISPFVSRAA